VEDLGVKTDNPAFTQSKPARAVSLMERSTKQARASPCRRPDVDPFLSNPGSFEGSGLEPAHRLSVHTLIPPYEQGAAALAYSGLPAARILANRVSLPEARRHAELFLARDGASETKHHTHLRACKVCAQRRSARQPWRKI
jgi:hypothetical protein